MNIKEKVRKYLIFSDYSGSKKGKIDQDKLRQDLRHAVDHVISEENISISSEEREKILADMIDEVAGMGPLNPLMNDPDVTEIMVNGPNTVYVERKGIMSLTDVKFDDSRHLMQIVEKIVSPTHRRVDESSPYVDVSLPDGSRVNIILPPLSLIGPVVTIRKFLNNIDTMEALISRDTLTENMAKFLIAAIKAKLNIIFAGSTGAGKTTTLSVLSTYISEDERIITIEDTAELHLKQKHVVPLETRQANVEGKGEIEIRELFKNSLRMRPNRIILGEIRGQEALDMLQAILSGHSGALAVLHASSPRDVISRIESMILTSNIGFPHWAIRQQISNAIDIIIMQEQLSDGSRKITHITEVGGIEKDELALKDLFSYEVKGYSEGDNKLTGEWKAWGVVPSFHPKFKLMGIDLPTSVFSSI